MNSSDFGLWTLDFGLSIGRFRRIADDEIDSRLNLHARLHLFALQRAHTLLEQLAVKIKAHRRDVPALLRAEQIARAANFQIAHRDFEPAAETSNIA